MGLLNKKKRKAVSLLPGLVGGYLVYAILDKARYIVNYVAVHYKGIEPPLMSMWWGIGAILIATIVGLRLWRMGCKVLQGDE